RFFSGADHSKAHHSEATRSAAVHCSPCLSKSNHGPAATSVAIAAQDANTNIAALPKMRQQRVLCGASSLRKNRLDRLRPLQQRPNALERRKPISLGKRVPIAASSRERAVRARSAAARER